MKRIIEIDEAKYNTIMCTPYSPVLGWMEIAQSEPYDEWISVDERLPEPLQPVLAYDNNDYFVAWYNEGWKSSDSQFDKYTPIVRWMPIPSYKKREETNEQLQ